MTNAPKRTIDDVRKSLFDLISVELKGKEADLKAELLAFADICLEPLRSRYAVLSLWSDESISDWQLDRIYSSIRSKLIPDKERIDLPILLLLHSRGGSIEPAYQISKLCQQFSNGPFEVVVPRRAKSAATLISLGASKIHMGPLGQLGPIDPQVGGMPALGARDSLREIANIVEQYPQSQELFALYLRMTMNVEKLGLFTRLAESAVQYGEKLLTRPRQGAEFAEAKAREIADRLVNHYKNHSFVIDADEAEEIFVRPGFICRKSDVIDRCELLYEHIQMFMLLIEHYQKQKLEILGAFDDGDSYSLTPVRD